MRKISLVIVLVLAVTNVVNAKIWRVNNNSNLKADVTQPSFLFDNTNNATNPEASAGDTIYIEASNVGYSGFTIDLPNIKVFGTGYLLQEYAALAAPVVYQANLVESEVTNITFAAGSTGSSIYGLNVPSVYIYESNDTVSRCFINNIGFYPAASKTGIRIEKSYIAQHISDQSIPTGATVQVAIENCIIAQTGGYSISFSNKMRGMIRNCVVSETGNFHAYNFYIANNIFVGNVNTGNNATNSGNNIFRNNFFSYNANAANTTAANTQPGNSGNVFAVNMANVFVGTPDNTTNGTTVFNNRINITAGVNTADSRFELKAGSLALGVGEGGSTVGGATVTTPDLGAYGATDPYRKAGIPPIPTIELFTVPSSIPSTATNITVTIKSKSNN